MVSLEMIKENAEHRKTHKAFLRVATEVTYEHIKLDIIEETHA